MKKRILSLLLALVMLLGMLPTVALAADDGWDGVDNVPVMETVDNVTYAEDVSGDNLKIIVDLRNYNGTVSGEWKDKDGNVFSIQSGMRNEILLTSNTRFSKNHRAVITLEDVTGLYDWSVIGAIDGRLKKSATQTEVVSNTVNGKGDWSFVVLKDNQITFDLQRSDVKTLITRDNWGGRTLTIIPVFEASTYIAEASSNNAEMGSAYAYAAGTANTYLLYADPKEGCTFEYWLKDGAPDNKITEQTHEITITENSHYTAYFRKAYCPVVLSSPENAASVSAEWVVNDTWRLTAAYSQQDYSFSNWSCEEDSSFSSNEKQTYVTLKQDGQHYVAHYLPWQITGISGMSAGGGSWMAKQEEGSRPLIAGTSVTVMVDYEENVSDVFLPHSTIELYSGDRAAVEAGKATLLAKREGQGDRDRNTAFDGGHATIIVDPWPADVTQITAVAYTDGCARHYYTLNVKTGYGAEGLNLSYLTSPRNCRTSAADPGPYNPDIYGAAAVQNAKTGEMELYVAGIGGVYQYTGTSGTTDFVRMNGMGDLTTAGDNHSMVGAALAVGGNGTENDGVTALILNYHALGGDQGGTSTYELRWYNREADQWEMVKHIPSDKTPSSIDKINAALIMASDEVWTDRSYYDGKDWQLHGLSFDHFEKVNFTTAYAVSTNGKTYKWNADHTGMDDAWEEVDLGGTLLGSRYDGALAVKLTSGGYAILNADGTRATYPEITKDIFGDTWTKDGVFKPGSYGESIVHTVGFGGDGKTYALVQGSGRNYVVRADGSEWTLMDTVEAFDVGGSIDAEKRPTVPSRIASLCQGVSLFYGGKGSLYLQTTEYGIDFDSNGGSAVDSITGQAWSGFIMPMPTKDGYAFAGWYRDAALTTLYESPVIPASRLTLYAKWRAAGTDRWAEDRQKALNQLEQAKGRLTETDYSEGNWQRVLSECENGKYAIAIAEPQPASSSESDINKAVNETIYAALNHAIDRMNAVPVLHVGNIEVVVSMDAQTLGLGYFIKPTVVTTKKYTQASTVITDAIVSAIKAQYKKDLKGYTTYHESEPAGEYAYMNTGSVASSFYLAQVYWPHQQRATVAEYIRKACELISDNQIEQDSRGKYLGEFDYYNMSGWMYSISNINDEVLPSFPGVGAAGWRMRDGEVMRWQFTVYGYGADLNADNSAWGQASITGDSGDKTQLTHDIAYLREEYKKTNAGTANDPYAGADAKLGTSGVYTSVFENVLCDPLATRAELDQAVADLKLVATELAERETFQNLASAIRSMGANEARITAAEGTFNGFSDAYKRIFELAYPKEFTLLQSTVYKGLHRVGI